MRTPIRGFGFALILLMGCSFSFADEIQIPFAIHVDQFKKDAKEAGFDLYDGDGFVENKGGRFVVYTYKTISFENLRLLKELTWKNLRK